MWVDRSQKAEILERRESAKQKAEEENVQRPTPNAQRPTAVVASFYVSLRGSDAGEENFDEFFRLAQNRPCFPVRDHHGLGSEA